MSLPWAPLFTVRRSGQPEITVHGIVSVIAGTGRTLVRVGDTESPLWTRSLIKPWQLMSLFPILVDHRPMLSSAHLALMMASHNGEPQHIRFLEELLAFADLQESDLQCPPMLPMSATARQHLVDAGQGPRPLYHPCSGKHIAVITACRSLKLPLDTYLDPDTVPYTMLTELLANLHVTDSSESAPWTQDGCGMPNIGLPPETQARLFQQLATASCPADPGLEPLLAEIRTLMTVHPELIGGTGRLDTRLMSGELTTIQPPNLIAKEGADGLLGIGVDASPTFPEGLGMLIKLASGSEPEHLETIARNILVQLGLANPPPVSDASLVETTWHFSVNTSVESRV